MRSVVRLIFAVVAALIFGAVLSAPQSAYAQGVGNPPSTIRTGSLAINEFRADGPNGSGDEYLYICNIKGDFPQAFQILSDDPAATFGIGIYSFRVSSGAPQFLFSIPDGTVFKPGACFIGVGRNISQDVKNYIAGTTPAATPAAFAGGAGAPAACTASLPAGYPCNIDALFPDADDIETDSGVAVFGSDRTVFGSSGTPALPTAFRADGTTPTTLIDRVGFDLRPVITFPGTQQPISPLFREEPALSPIGAPGTWSKPSANIAFVRRHNPAGTGQQIQDTDNNQSDFFGGANAPNGGQSRPVATNSYQASSANSGAAAQQTTATTFNNFSGLQSAVIAILGAPAPQSFTGTITAGCTQTAADQAPAPICTITGGGVPGGTPIYAAGSDSYSRTKVGSPRARRFNQPGTTDQNIAFSFAFDTTKATSPTVFGPPNRERVYAVPSGGQQCNGAVCAPQDNNEVNAPNGTYAVRATITNQTGQELSRLRFRFADLTTDNRGLETASGSATEAGQALMRLVSSRSARVFVAGGRDQDCQNATTGTNTTPCGGTGYRLVQGLLVEGDEDETQALGAYPAPGFPIGDPGSGVSPAATGVYATFITAVGGGGINNGLVVEQNSNGVVTATSFPTTNAGTCAAGNPAIPAGGPRCAGVPTNTGGGGTITTPSSAVLRGTGTLNLATPLRNTASPATADSMSVEFRWGVRRGGKFFQIVVPEADGCGSNASLPCVNVAGGTVGNTNANN